MALRKLRMRDGRIKWVKGGTQKADGLFAGLRNKVGRRPINTTHRTKLLERIRSLQWRLWLGKGKCKFSAVGELLRDELARIK